MQKFSPVPPCLRVVLLILSVEEKKQRRVVFFFLGSPQHFVPLRFRSPPLYFSSAGAQFLPPQSPVIKPVQNRSLTYTYFLGSVLVFFSSAQRFFLFFFIYPRLNLPNVFVKVRKAVLFFEVLMNPVNFFQPWMVVVCLQQGDVFV